MADGPNVGFATLQVIPSMRGVQAHLAGQMAGPSAVVGKQAGGTMATAMGGALKVGLGSALAGLGALGGLAKLGGSFDKAFDTIRVGTGATGEALEDLKGSFKTVFSSAPTDMALASQAVADLNTRLGLTGGPLEDMATRLLELSRITKTDLGANIEAVTRVFGDWGVSAEEQAGHLDALFRSSQATGITVDTLSQQMVKYGAPLRQLGFDFDTTAGLLGKFEKEGVNAELVMGSMRIALGRMAREGIPAEEGLRQIVDQIAAAGSTSEANALALELFGARAGPDMAAAIREGRFDLGELYDTIANGEETILGAAEDTKDFGERWNEFKNQILVGLEPLATGVFDAISTGMELLSSWWDANGENVLGFFRGIGEALGGITTAALDALSNWWDTNGETIKGAFRTFVDFIKDPVITTLDSFVQWFTDNEYAMKAFGILVGTTLVGAFAAYTLAALGAAAATIIAIAPWVLAAIAVGALIAVSMWLIHVFNDQLNTALQWLADRFEDVWVAVNTVIESFKQAWEWAKKLWDLIQKIEGFTPGNSRGPIPNFGDWLAGQFRASGGPVTAGMPYIVGERRPELFVPNQSGYILPSVPGEFGGGMGGGATITVQVTEVAGEPHGVTAIRELRRLQLLQVG